MPSINLEMLRIDEIEYDKMHEHQVDNIMFSAKMLEKMNKQKRKKNLLQNQLIQFTRDKSKLDPGE